MSDKAFVGYEYQEVAVKNGMTSVYADGYENFDGSWINPMWRWRNAATC